MLTMQRILSLATSSQVDTPDAMPFESALNNATGGEWDDGASDPIANFRRACDWLMRPPDLKKMAKEAELRRKRWQMTMTRSGEIRKRHGDEAAEKFLEHWMRMEAVVW